VGETLRGTMNSSIDRHLHASAETIAADNRVAESGRAEMQTGHFSDLTKERERTGKVRGILRKPRPEEARASGSGYRGVNY